MYAIFPYARQHNGGFPKEMVDNIRDGAMKMIVFEELVYQEALRRGMTVPAAKLEKAEEEFRGHRCLAQPVSGVRAHGIQRLRKIWCANGCAARC